jgi:hypothetical protein
MINVSDSEKISRAVSLLAMFGVTITMVLMIIALGKLDALADSTEKLSKSAAKTSEQIDALALRIVGVERNIGALEDVVSVGRGIPVVYSTDYVDPSTIQDGLYILERGVTLKYPTRVGSYSRDFTLYHLRLPIGSGKLSSSINAGIAVAGVSNPQFYIDYNSDNAIDHALMQEMVDFVPFSGLIARTMNEYNSQTMYNVFLDNHSSAKQITIDSIEEEAGTVAKGLWIAVDRQKNRIMELIAGDAEEAKE